MNMQEILKLVDAGFTKDEIMAFHNGTFLPQGSREEAAATAPPAEPAETPAPAPAPEPAAQPAADNSAVLAALEKLTAVVQKQAIRSDALQPDKKLSAEDILAEVINPKQNK